MRNIRPRHWIVGALAVAALAVAVVGLRPEPSAADGTHGHAPTDTAAEPSIGVPPPSFTAERIVGSEPASLAALRGHVVVLAFVSTRCRACHRALGELQRLARDRRGDGLRVLAVVSEPAGRVRAFAQGAELDLTFARVGAEAANRYGVRFIPDMFLLDREGRLRGRVTGSQDADLDALRAQLAELL